MKVITKGHAEARSLAGKRERHKASRTITDGNVTARIEPLITYKQIGFGWILLLLGQNNAG